MGKYLIRRLLLVIPVFIGITLITFALSHLIPGDPFQSEKTPPAVRVAIAHSYGLDKPLWEQYILYVANFLRGDWGPSFERQGQASVTDIIFGTDSGGPPWWLAVIGVAAMGAAAFGIFSLIRLRLRSARWTAQDTRRIMWGAVLAVVAYGVVVLLTADTAKAGGFIFSARLGLMAFAFTLVIGIPLGIIAAYNQNKWLDYVISTVVLVGYAIPSFVLGLLALIVVVILNVTFKLSLPVAPTSPGLLDLVLPATLLGLREAAIIARLTRASMIEVLRQDYLRTAEAKGLGSRILLLRHALKNALLPVVTVLGDEMSGLLTGSVTIERVFNVPGIGYYFVGSILAYDYPMILGTVVLYAMLVVFINLGVDMLYAVIDPRISYTTQKSS